MHQSCFSVLSAFSLRRLGCWGRVEVERDECVISVLIIRRFNQTGVDEASVCIHVIQLVIILILDHLLNLRSHHFDYSPYIGSSKQNTISQRNRKKTEDDDDNDSTTRTAIDRLPNWFMYIKPYTCRWKILSFNSSHVQYSVFSLFGTWCWRLVWLWLIKRFSHISA